MIGQAYGMMVGQAYGIMVKGTDGLTVLERRLRFYVEDSFDFFVALEFVQFFGG